MERKNSSRPVKASTAGEYVQALPINLASIIPGPYFQLYELSQARAPRLAKYRYTLKTKHPPQRF
jgi:hypothetical protein